MLRSLAVVALALLTSVAARAADRSPNEALYAQLATLSPAERERRLEAGARSEGTLAVLNDIRGEDGRKLLALFAKRYPFVKLDVTELGSQDVAQRLYAEETAGRHLTDVAEVAVPDMSLLLDHDLLARFPTPATRPILPRYRAFLDAQQRYVPFWWAEHGISYNTNLVTADKAPKSWFDLCSPAFRGSVSYDPGETRFLVGLYTMLGDAGVQKLLKCIGENKPIVTRGHDERLALMLAGDHMVQGDNYFFEGVAKKRANPSVPFAMVTSTPLLAYASTCAINKNSQHPYGAALFCDWTLSKESQDFLAEVRLSGPMTVKHPFLPDSVKLVTFGVVPATLVDKLQGYWKTYVANAR
jgi:ABC-type Fe3+ transport system substrate-binding protein